MRHRLVIALAALCAVACHDARFGEPEEATPPPATMSIAQVRKLFSGETFEVTGEVVVEGRVTSSDRHRNFYRTLCIEQDGAALEVMAGVDHLHNDYPVGCHVTLRLRSLALGMSYGVLQAGRYPTPASGYPTDYIASPAALAAALIRHEGPVQAPVPTRCTLAELRPEMAGRLIRIDGLHYTPEELSPGTWAGYKRFTDAQGTAILSYVRAYADFATQEVPAEACALVGILQWDKAGEGRYMLKLRDESDCIP